MKHTILLVSLMVLLASCGKQKEVTGPDYDAIKPDLLLSNEQEKQFDEITSKYNALRMDAIGEARSGGKMNREVLLAHIMEIFEKQGLELHIILSQSQFQNYSEWIVQNTPGRVGWSKKLVKKIKSQLDLHDDKALMVDAANDAFIESYIDAHDHYHGNDEAAKEYWTMFNENRLKAMKTVLTNEEYITFLEVTKEAVFKGEHGKKK